MSPAFDEEEEEEERSIYQKPKTPMANKVINAWMNIFAMSKKV